MTLPTPPEAFYRAQVAEWTAERDRQQRRSDRNGNVSVVLLSIEGISFGLWLWLLGPWLLVLAIGFAVAFTASFMRHGAVNRSLRRARELLTISQEGLARLERDWPHIPLHDAAEADSAHHYAADLELCGYASLEHLLHTPATPVGRETLRAWLLAPAPPEQIRARQQAAAELAPNALLRRDLALAGRLLPLAQRGYEQFLTWAESDLWLLKRPWLIWASRVLAVAAVGLLAARLANANVGLPLAIVLLLNLLLYFGFARALEQRIQAATARQTVYTAYAELFALVTTAAFETAELRQLQQALSASTLRADQQMRRLARLMPPAELRTWMFFFPIQITTLWNFHILWLLERWQRDAGQHARAWLVALGEFEALTALATLAYDNPSWVFADVEGAGAAGNMLRAQGLGHPLLPPAQCVGNDVTIGPPGTLMLVTGSNMSGKSTLLRAIGVNTVLAQAGGPTCASALHMPPTALVTSMRVRDSLDQGVSYFMAELQRLKLVVDQAEATSTHGQCVPLFLLDEILHGTNSAERLVAARAILRHLLEVGATGAVSTHDLALADTPELAHLMTLAHFSEQFSRGPHGPTMDFDYHLRPGVATTTNALKLMELIGLPIA